LVDAIARHHAWPAEGVVVSGGGSIELIDRSLRALTDPGDAIGVHFPAFHGVGDACARLGRTMRLVPEKPGDAGLARLSSIASSVRACVVASPNAIDSRVFDPSELDALRAALGPGKVLLLDEAYAGFDSDALTPLYDDASLAPVLRLRTLSKLDGLAGLRLGYALTTSAVARSLRKESLPYAVLEWQEIAAISALDDPEHRDRVRRSVATSRARLIDGLTASGFTVEPSTTHLLLARPPDGTFAAWEGLAESRSLPLEPSASFDGAFELSVPDEATLDALLQVLAGTTSSR